MFLAGLVVELVAGSAARPAVRTQNGLEARAFTLVARRALGHQLSPSRCDAGASLVTSASAGRSSSVQNWKKPS